MRDARGRKPTPVPADLPQLIAGGASLPDLKNRYNIAERTIRRWLNESGLKPTIKRGGSYTSRSITWQRTSTQEKIDATFTPEQRARFWSNVSSNRTDDCWLWNGSQTKSGYGSHNVGGWNLRTNRVAYLLTKGPIPADLHIMHSCNTRLCCNPAHLSAGTIQENLAHREKYGNPAKAMRCGRRKLRADEVYAIRESDEPRSVLAKRYSVHHTAIGEIKRRTTWASLPERDPVTKELVVEKHSTSPLDCSHIWKPFDDGQARCERCGSLEWRGIARV